MIVVLLALTAGAAELSGTLVDEAGEPLTGGLAIAYDQRFGYLYAEVDADGAWQIEGLPANPYRVRFLSPYDRDAVEAWWGGGFDVCAAEVLDLSAPDASKRLDQVLEPGATLSGRVLTGDAEPLAGAVVSAQTVGDPTTESRVAVTAQDGSFTLTGVPLDLGVDGLYHLGLYAEGLPDQLMGGAYDEAYADIIHVTPGSAEDLGDWTALPGITVLGTATGPDGPIADGWAYVYTPSQVVTAAIVDGVYEAQGLPPGPVIAWAQAEGYGTTYWPDRAEPGDPFTDASREGQVVEGVDLVLPFEARLVGRVVGDGDLGSVSVLAYSESHLTGFGEVTDDDGRFAIGGLHAGAYELYAWAAKLGRVDGYLTDDAGAVRLVDVAEGEDSEELVVDLPLGASLHGVVRDRYTGRPVYGATVVALGQTTGASESTVADLDGAYELAGLVADDYIVYAGYEAWCPADADWVSVYHPDATWDGVATPVALAEGDREAWDPSLPPDADHDGMDDLWETVHGLDPSVDDSAADPDEDGYSNLDEYLQGTDPMEHTAAPGSGARCGCGGGLAASWAWLPLTLLVRRRRLGVS